MSYLPHSNFCPFTYRIQQIKIVKLHFFLSIDLKVVSKLQIKSTVVIHLAINPKIYYSLVIHQTNEPFNIDVQDLISIAISLQNAGKS